MLSVTAGLFLRLIERSYGTVTEDGKLGLGENGRIWNKDASDEEIDSVIRTDYTREIAVCAAGGALLILCAFLFFRKKG